MSIKELMMINEETILSLLKIYKDDEKILNTIQRCLISFEEYHSQIYKLEICMKIFSNGNVDKDNYKIRRKANWTSAEYGSVQTKWKKGTKLKSDLNGTIEVEGVYDYPVNSVDYGTTTVK